MCSFTPDFDKTNTDEILDASKPNCQTVPMDDQAKNLVDFDKAVILLRAEKPCAFATDTVFGLGARGDSSSATLALFTAKQRPLTRPLVMLCADLDMAKSLVEFSPMALKLAAFWPGALTLVLPKYPGANVAPEAGAGRDSLGVRIPNSIQVRDLIEAVGQPLATTSANISGQDPALTPQQVNEQFAGNIPVLEGGQAVFTVPSTILRVEGDKVELLRAGEKSVHEIELELDISIHSNI